MSIQCRQTAGPVGYVRFLFLSWLSALAQSTGLYFSFSREPGSSLETLSPFTLTEYALIVCMQPSPALLSLLPWPWLSLVRVLHRKPLAMGAPSQPPLSSLPPRPPHTPFDPLRLCPLAHDLLTSLSVPSGDPLPPGLLSEEASGISAAGRGLVPPGKRWGRRPGGVWGAGDGATTIRWGCFPGRHIPCSWTNVFSPVHPGSEARYCEGETRRGPGLRSYS